jgi:DNA-binding MarR family transcriptional regulator
MSETNLWAAWTLRSHDALSAATASVVPAGLGQRDLAALTLIASHDGCSADWLWNRIGLTQSGTVRLIDRLVKLAYVVRARQGRTLALGLTPSGQKLLAAWQQARNEAGRAVLGVLTADEQEQLDHLLAAALRRTERVRATADATCRLCDWRACTPCPVDESVDESP